MAITINGKIYRNLEEQVRENMKNIAEIEENMGTQVVANPEDEATADLTKIKISDTTYQVSSDDAVWGNITGTLSDQTDLQTVLNGKQATLTAGTNITISGDTISATDTTYSNLPAAVGGTDVSLVTTGEKAIWNGKQNELIAGANITITDNVISATGVLSSVVWGQIGGSLSDQTDLKSALDGKQATIDANNKLSASYISGLATVATSGDYNDLTNKPTIPAAQVNSDWNAVSGVAQILNKPDLSVYALSAGLATVATSGDYNDLTNKPTIPVVNYPVTDVTVDGTSVMDGTVAKITMPTIPTKTSDLQNDSGFITGITWGGITGTLSNQTDLASALSGKQNTLISGTNIKTINGTSLLGDGDLVISAGTSYSAGTGISIANNTISMAHPYIVILGVND